MAAQSATASPSQRVDKWLWFARFFKTRGLAAKLVSGGHVRVNSQRISKPAQAVRPGDVLTFPQARAIRVIEIVALGQRRGPAPEARALYHDLAPPETTPPEPEAQAAPRSGARPTKKERRDATKLKTLGRE